MSKEKNVAHKQVDRKIKELEEKINNIRRNWKTSKENENSEENRGRLARLYDINLIYLNVNPKDNA